MFEGRRTILVVDDEPDILLVVRVALEASGFEVRTARSATAALESLARHGLPHLAILDIVMPGSNGLELARQLLEYCDLPIIMLTAVDRQETVVKTLDEVCEDYVVKPFNPDELVARVSRVLRRVGDFGYTLAPVLEIDDHLSIDFTGRVVTAAGTRRVLTPTESKILHILVRGAGRPIASGFLLTRVWPLDQVYEDTLRVHVHRLRQKIEPNPSAPSYLVTERGIGYSFLPKA